VSFFADFTLWPKVGERVRLIYKLSINEYRGEKQLQLMVEKVIPYH
jgi:single-stranded-DNA-specific exonuclease